MGIRGPMILVDPASKLVHTAVRKKPFDPPSFAEALALGFAVLEQLGKTTVSQLTGVFDTSTFGSGPL